MVDMVGNGTLRRPGLAVLPSRSTAWVKAKDLNQPSVPSHMVVGRTGASLRVLLIEDEPGDALLVTQALRMSRAPVFAVTHVPNLAGAIALLAEDHSFDVVLLDLSLPDSTGVATLSRMQEAAPRLPIVIMTGMDDPTFANYALEVGAQDFLVKSDDPERTVARAIRYAITRMSAQLEARALAERVVMQQKSLMEELATARAMQFDLLPRPARLDPVLSALRLRVEAAFEPSSGIGGDLWGSADCGPGRVGFYTFDFSGHGIGAALNVFRLHALIADRWDSECEPAETLATLGGLLHGLVGRGQFATMFLCVVDTNKDELVWAAAGAPPPLLIDNGTATFLDSRGVPLGLTRSPRYTNHRVAFRPGASLLLYSDAITDAALGNERLFGEDGLSALVERLLGEGGEVTVERLLEKFHDVVRPPLDDDLTALCISRLPE